MLNFTRPASLETFKRMQQKKSARSAAIFFSFTLSSAVPFSVRRNIEMLHYHTRMSVGRKYARQQGRNHRSQELKPAPEFTLCCGGTESMCSAAMTVLQASVAPILRLAAAALNTILGLCERGGGVGRHASIQ